MQSADCCSYFVLRPEDVKKNDNEFMESSLYMTFLWVNMLKRKDESLMAKAKELGFTQLSAATYRFPYVKYTVMPERVERIRRGA